MKKLMHWLFLSCLKATELIEKKIYFKLSLRERMQLEVHKMMCDACSNYEKDSLLIDKALQKQSAVPPVIKGIDLKAFEQSLIKKLDDVDKV
jgi:hypothetical protein